MSQLTIYSDHDPETREAVHTEPAQIGSALAAYGVRYTRASTLAPLDPAADADAVLAAYASFIAAEKAERGYQVADVIRLVRGTPDTAAMRAKFLSEHTHSEDEARLFAEGSGAFYLHIDGKVLVVVCERGDYLRVPAGTRHWFDMGPDPEFTAVRLFTDPAGWVASFTGEAIADRFPRYE
jgi:1,2-dihydroxy-3-keto-5-methylthiopentene dioxygenase